MWCRAFCCLLPCTWCSRLCPGSPGRDHAVPRQLPASKTLSSTTRTGLAGPCSVFHSAVSISSFIRTFGCVSYLRRKRAGTARQHASRYYHDRRVRARPAPEQPSSLLSWPTRVGGASGLGWGQPARDPAAEQAPRGRSCHAHGKPALFSNLKKKTNQPQKNRKTSRSSSSTPSSSRRPATDRTHSPPTPSPSRPPRPRTRGAFSGSSTSRNLSRASTWPASPGSPSSSGSTRPAIGQSPPSPATRPTSSPSPSRTLTGTSRHTT